MGHHDRSWVASVCILSNVHVWQCQIDNDDSEPQCIVLPVLLYSFVRPNCSVFHAHFERRKSISKKQSGREATTKSSAANNKKLVNVRVANKRSKHHCRNNCFKNSSAILWHFLIKVRTQMVIMGFKLHINQKPFCHKRKQFLSQKGKK